MLSKYSIGSTRKRKRPIEKTAPGRTATSLLGAFAGAYAAAVVATTEGADLGPIAQRSFGLWRAPFSCTSTSP